MMYMHDGQEDKYEEDDVQSREQPRSLLLDHSRLS